MLSMLDGNAGQVAAKIIIYNNSVITKAAPDAMPAAVQFLYGDRKSVV